MAKQNSKDSNHKSSEKTQEKLSWKPSRQQKFVGGVLLLFLSLALLLSFISYFITGTSDQSEVGELVNRSVKTENWLGKIGAFLADFFLYKGFGVASFIFIRVIFLVGAYLILDMTLIKLKKSFFWDFYLIITGSILLGFFWDVLPQLGGTIGFEMNLFIQDYIGKTGTLLVLLFGIIIFLVFKINISPESFTSILKNQTAHIKMI